MDTIKVEMEDTDMDFSTQKSMDHFDNNILLQNNDIGNCIKEELMLLKNCEKHKSVKIVCSNGVLFSHHEPILLSTTLLDGTNNWKDTEFTLLCLDSSMHILNLVLEVFYTGITAFSCQEERAEVLKCLRNLCWVGMMMDDDLAMGELNENEEVDSSPMDNSRLTSTVKLSEAAPDRTKIGKSRSVNSEERGQSKLIPTPSDGEDMTPWLQNYPDFQQKGRRIFCNLCHSYPNIREGYKQGVLHHMQTLKHVKAQHELESKGNDFVDSEHSNNDELDSDGDDDDEYKEWLNFYTEGNGNPGCDAAEGTDERQANPADESIMEAREQEFEDLIKLKGHMLCRYCKVPVNWRHKSRIHDHLKSAKHLKKKKFPSATKTVERGGNTEAEDDGMNQAQQMEYNEEKQQRRLEEFPWLVKIQNEFMCFLCKISIDWTVRNSLLEHSKTKKHRACIENKRDAYPELMQKIEDAKNNSSFNDVRPNNSNKLRFKIYLKHGVQAIQKLWITGVMSGKIVDEVSLCYVCFRIFVNEDDLPNHLESEHNGLENKLVDSPYYNNDTKEYFCHGCNKYRVPRGSLMAFMFHNLNCNGKFESVSEPLKCLRCDQLFTEYQHFKKHMLASHMEAEARPEDRPVGEAPRPGTRRYVCRKLRHTCEHCAQNPLSFSNKKELRAHMAAAHNILEAIQCKQCPAKFRTFKAMSRHVTKFHLGVKNYACETCGKTFYSKYDLARHTRTHMHPDQRPFSCLVCGMRFKEQKHLNNHEATHSEERPHRCLMCDARFKVRDRLSRHCIKDHGISMKEVETKALNSFNNEVADPFQPNLLKYDLN